MRIVVFRQLYRILLGYQSLTGSYPEPIYDYKQINNRLSRHTRVLVLFIASSMKYLLQT